MPILFSVIFGVALFCTVIVLAGLNVRPPAISTVPAGGQDAIAMVQVAEATMPPIVGESVPAQNELVEAGTVAASLPATVAPAPNAVESGVVETHKDVAFPQREMRLPGLPGLSARSFKVASTPARPVLQPVAAGASWDQKMAASAS